MISEQITLLWEKYLAAERVRVRQEALDVLARFVDALLRLPEEIWQPWARQIARRIVDDKEAIPVRFPLFRAVVFPALLAGLENGVPGTARWLAGFSQSLYKSPGCRERLPEDQRTEYGLLLRAVREDETDARAKTRLLQLMRNRFAYALHELPTGVLYGHDGATSEQCDELLQGLADYERLAWEVGPEEEDRELIAEARFHLSAYRTYLQREHGYANYEAFLKGSEPG